MWNTEDSEKYPSFLKLPPLKDAVSEMLASDKACSLFSWTSDIVRTLVQFFGA